MKCFLFGADNSSPSTTAVEYNRLNAIFPSSWTANESLRREVLPVALELSNFYITIDTAPGAGSSFTFIIFKNGVATSLSVTISDTNTSGQDSVHSVSFAAGDTVDIQSSPTGTPVAPSNIYWNVQVETSGRMTPLLTGLPPMSTSATQYGGMLAGHAAAMGWSATETDLQIIVPAAGTIQNLYATLSTAPGASKSYDFTIMVNGVASSLAATVSGTSTTGNNTSTSVSVAPGDALTVRSVPTNTPAGATPSFGLTFTPSSTGESFIGYGSPSAPSATATNYDQIMGIGNQAWSATESSRYMLPGPCTLRGLQVKIGTAPGVGAARTFTIRKSTGDTPLSVTISDSSTTGSVAANVECAQGEFILVKSTVTGTPAALTGGVHLGLLLYNDPKAPVVMVY